MKSPSRKTQLVPKGRSLPASTANDADLTPLQREFNRLTLQIAALREENLRTTEKLEALTRAFHKYLIPASEAVAQVRLALAAALETAALHAQLGKQQMADVGECIVDLTEAAFVMVAPTTETIALHDRWATRPYFEPRRQQLAGGLDEVEQTIVEMLGGDVDIAMLKLDRDEYAKLAAAAKAKLQAEAEAAHRKQNARQRTAAAAQARATAALKARSIRSIYIALAKLIHPDMEPDPDLRLAKEEEMKDLIAAYEASDLATLLQMELSWVHRQADALDRIPAAQMAVYVQVLQDQVQELTREKADLYRDGHFAPILPYATGKQESGVRSIKSDAKWLLQWVQATESQVRDLRAQPTPAALIAFVKSLQQAARGDRGA